uniref:Uncharacterized protein n=1 Tax=Trieres chinensis TaxID=1514140 RepID=A0A7S1ZSE6_TRICV|mmetsp:Transcript_3168/g.6852  ORF Transcript_3168/g.6852 Transcript_3168/m.6852 type:complete len:305 (+) Transcript_3168:171-1085(+)|eukprot:CAMPEP_0183314274 /NCGR_PEP_ID=MMETSP0160_2-20130417/47957_1 /TAXON_ID=2839 ORGANISM="Odontella Sinensis, Strain Grunow 1884" /NCGR_SAMPLE_ID=MMETSP0160_2 /ASSEMBLY_ACC=CAM_ASM_000250 /LENGTH=304 /DNA_ID=CAMNT_0025479561 /DNA_START=171 /DNA_END=1085 /DNA_ORIENTATION=-
MATAEMHKVSNDPNFAVQFAVGDPFPKLVPQERNSGIRVTGVYFDEPKRYVLKKALMSREDNRIFDKETGRIVMVSHHPGKNPYEGFDPLGLSDDSRWNHKPTGGEWECVCDVSAKGPFRSFSIRPKALSRHGRQNIKIGKATVMNVGKMGKLKSMSARPHYIVGRGTDDDPVYTLVADMMGRTVSITNDKGELVAQMAKTSKALIKTAVFGSGSESTIDIAPGVDCSAILMIVYGLGQVGEHFMKDALGNYISDPLKDSAVSAATEATGTSGHLKTYQRLTGSVVGRVDSLQKQAKFFKQFFQ